jgi:hypothetical protein
MAKQGGRTARRKKQSAVDKQAGKPKDGNPKSMVIRIGAGEVGTSVSQLVTDVRHVMEPDTAVRLKVRLDWISFSFMHSMDISLTLLFHRSDEPTSCATM